MEWRVLTLVVVSSCGRFGFEGRTCEQCVDIDAALDAPRDAPKDGVFDPFGSFVVAPPIAYTCASGIVTIGVGKLTFSDGGATLKVTSDDAGTTPQPCLMTGPPATNAFDVTCTLPGICNETYRLAGMFTGADTWTATFTAGFTGTCLDCTLKTFPITGTR